MSPRPRGRVSIALGKGVAALRATALGYALTWLAGCSGPATSTPAPTPNIQATVQAAVATAVADLANDPFSAAVPPGPTATPSPGREAWVAFSSGVQAIESAAWDVLYRYCNILVLSDDDAFGEAVVRELDPPPSIMDVHSWREIWQLQFAGSLGEAFQRHADLRRQAAPLVLPETAQLGAIRVRNHLSRALTGLDVLEEEALSTVTGKPQTQSSVTSDARKVSAFGQSRDGLSKARNGLWSELNQQGIGLDERARCAALGRTSP